MGPCRGDALGKADRGWSRGGLFRELAYALLEFCFSEGLDLVCWWNDSKVSIQPPVGSWWLREILVGGCSNPAAIFMIGVWEG